MRLYLCIYDHHTYGIIKTCRSSKLLLSPRSLSLSLYDALCTHFMLDCVSYIKDAHEDASHIINISGVSVGARVCGAYHDMLGSDPELGYKLGWARDGGKGHYALHLERVARAGNDDYTSAHRFARERDVLRANGK